MQYLVLMHGNAVSFPSDEDWDDFFTEASRSGLFRGGSAVNNARLMGNLEAEGLGERVVGYMRFDSDDYQALVKLLEKHPVVAHGGTVEIYDMPIDD